jgi:FkbH-like protein
VRKEIDARLDALIAGLNENTFPHVHKFDECALRARASDSELGRYFHVYGLQHPARFGAEVAGEYDLILETLGNLHGKKLIVCDLDNTLWDGVIGEGAVSHFADRQHLLARLKKKGVLLAVASKNDPKNVHWTGGVLSEDDFVYSYIAWTPKVAAFSAIQQSLNLKTKDFIFIDDRADERAMVEDAHPEIFCYDPTVERTWRAFALWEQLLGDEPDMDRTQMYHDRAKREAFTAEQTADAPDESAMFASLGLRIRIWEAGKKDIARATELINRTNQFNMQGSRTTFAQMNEWRDSKDHRIYLASMADRFGDMGVISVLVADLTGEAVEIPIFVLSCRVFGYGGSKPCSMW